MESEITKEDLERVFSEEGTLEEKLHLYPYFLDISQSLSKRKGADLYTILSEMGLSERAKSHISSFLNSQELNKRLKIGSKIASMREVMKVNTEKFHSRTRGAEQELEEAIDTLNLYGLLLITHKAVTREEWKSILSRGEDNIFGQYPRNLAYNFIENNEEEVRYNIHALEILSSSILLEAIRRKFSLLLGVNAIESLIEENSIRNFFSEDFLDTIKEARLYIKEAEENFVKIVNRMESLLKSIPLPEEERAVVGTLFPEERTKNKQGVYIIFDAEAPILGLPEYIDTLLHMTIKKSDYDKLKKKILS